MKDYLSHGNPPGSRATICKQGLPSLIHLLHRRLQEHGEKVVYTYLKDGESQETRLTYCELERRALAIAAHLQSHYSPGDRVLLLYPPGTEFPTAFFGCLCAGMVAVPAFAVEFGDEERLVVLHRVTPPESVQPRWPHEVGHFG